MTTDESDDDWIRDALLREFDDPLPNHIRPEEAIELARQSDSNPEAVNRLMEGLLDGFTFSRLVQGVHRNKLDAEAVLPIFMLALERYWDRRHALGWLRELGPQSRPALPEILKYASDANPETRVAVIESIAAIAPDELSIILPLTEALNDEYPEVRWRAAEILGAFGPSAKGALAALSEMAESDRNIKVRRCALEATMAIQGSA